jgi:hypothetical protein
MNSANVVSFTLQMMDDPNRHSFQARIIAPAKPSSSDRIDATVNGNIWIADNPPFRVIQLRILDAASRAFALTESEQKQAAVT